LNVPFILLGRIFNRRKRKTRITLKLTGFFSEEWSISSEEKTISSEEKPIVSDTTAFYLKTKAIRM
jgi:hypothetical protein